MTNAPDDVAEYALLPDGEADTQVDGTIKSDLGKPWRCVPTMASEREKQVTRSAV